jgi:hypothetical protein
MRENISCHLLLIKRVNGEKGVKTERAKIHIHNMTKGKIKIQQGKGKGKIQPRTGKEGPKGQ